MKRRSIRILAMLISLFILMIPVYGMTPVETDRICTVKITDYPGEGAHFRFYKVADIDETMLFTLTETFQPYEEKVIVNNTQDQQTWADTAATLSAYVNGDGLPFTHEGYIKNGELYAELETGLYLILADPVEYDGWVYKCQPIITCAPTAKGNTADVEVWNYDFEINPKFEKEKPDYTEKTYKVIKQWQDGRGVKRPAEITVNILKNGKVFEEVKLNKSNDWCYTWTAEDDGSEWQVQEVNIPSGYRAEISRNQTRFVIRNHAGTPDTSDPGVDRTPLITLCVSGLAAVISGFLLLKSRKEEAEG